MSVDVFVLPGLSGSSVGDPLLDWITYTAASRAPADSGVERGGNNLIQPPAEARRCGTMSSMVRSHCSVESVGHDASQER